MALTNNQHNKTLETGVAMTLSGTGGIDTSSRSGISTFIMNLGNEIISGMGEERNLIGSMSHTLHFITLLGLNSKRGVRRVGEKKVSCLTTVGVTLVSDKPIQVPVIPVTRNKDTGISQTDISSRRVQKGKPFNLNMYELMFLLIRKEYAGFMSYDGDSKGVVFAPKLAYFLNGKTKLPTPALSFKYGQGSIKETMVDIDEKIGNRWKIKDQYSKEFGDLLTTKAVPRKTKKVSVSTSTTVALAVGKMLENKLQLDA